MSLFVKVGWHRYEVIFDKQQLQIAALNNNIHESLVGLTDVQKTVIWVDDDMSLSQIQDTLLHELLHALFDACGLSVELEGNIEERIVRVLAPALLSMLKDNPGLVKKLGVSERSKKS
jgi:hypothetical protein